jgi:ElaB/YqjD/DUF883 family membrane-anchored ribosome-binding protein
MEPKNSKIFSREIMQAVTALCESKGIKDVDNFIYLCFKQGFDIRKYGLLGGEVSGEVSGDVSGEVPVKTLNEGEKHLKSEVIREIRVEVPVEIIKEVPVEVIKEVEKIIYTSDDTQVNELLLKIEQLDGEISIKTTEIDRIRQEFSIKTEEMDNFFQNKMSKKDEELDELRQKLDILVTNNRVNMLQETLQNLRSELQQKNEQIKELEKINRELINGNQNQGYLMRGSNLNRRI